MSVYGRKFLLRQGKIYKIFYIKENASDTRTKKAFVSGFKRFSLFVINVTAALPYNSP